mgnify:CR=1 FL=1|tara:strand:+ start:74528 stop:75664 length:1137 start_codon:yes stop_codon:yes gene_type:complete
MSKVYKTSLVRGVFHQWTNSKSVMEFVQNFIDSDGEGVYSWLEDGIILTNKNIKVSHKMLLMGLSDKREDPTKLGVHGIGSSQAMAILTDRGIDVTIQNNDIVWKPEFVFDEVFDHDILVFKEYLAAEPNSDFSVCIRGLSEEDLDEIKQRALLFQQREVLYSTKLGDIIANPEDDEGGEVFCGGLFVCQSNGFKYSYNMKPSILKLSTERNAVDNWELKKLTAKIWNLVEDKDLMTQAIKSDTEDCYLVNIYNSGKGHSATEDLSEEFIKENGVCLVTDNFSDYETNVALGNPCKYIENTALVESIQNGSAYNDMLDNLEVVEKKTPSEKVAETVDNVLEFLWQENLISTEQEGDNDNDWLKEDLLKLKEESYKWRN